MMLERVSGALLLLLMVSLTPVLVYLLALLWALTFIVSGPKDATEEARDAFYLVADSYRVAWERLMGRPLDLD